jgi:hypothetical protein
MYSPWFLKPGTSHEIALFPPHIADESSVVCHSSHDYATVLSELAKRIGLALPAAPSIEYIDDILAQHGWRPPLDVLRQVSVWTPWISCRFFTDPKVDLSGTCKGDALPIDDGTARP